MQIIISIIASTIISCLLLTSETVRDWFDEHC